MGIAKRPIRIEGDVAYIPLTKGYEAVIDVEDVPLVEGRNWTALEDRHRDGNIRNVYAYRATQNGKGKRSTILLHREITKTPLDLEVDHRDGNGLNNCRRGEAGNLRLVTESQNQQNRRGHRNSRSGLKGISWHTKAGKWRTRVSAKGKDQYCELFVCLARAIIAVKRERRRLHGDFARD